MDKTFMNHLKDLEEKENYKADLTNELMEFLTWYRYNAGYRDKDEKIKHIVNLYLVEYLAKDL